MAVPQQRPPVGSIWTVRGVENGHALVILGPIMREKTGSQFVVVPVYSGDEPGFGWTDQDVRLDPEETSYAKPRFLGVWNARLVYERELERFVMRVPDAHIAIAIAQDVYWAASQGRRLKHPRLGSEMREGSEATLFQERERKRWAASIADAGRESLGAAEEKTGERTSESGQTTTS
jgi:hypothetical protein